jgi:hypothetical protein
MRGLPVDRIPFIGRMDLWYRYHHNAGTLPHPYEKASLWDLQRDLGIGIFGFDPWGLSFYRLVHHGVEIEVAARGRETTTMYHTPHGTLRYTETMAAELMGAAGTGARTEYPFKSAHDYDALQFFIEHTQVVENFYAYGAFIDAVGTDGLALPFTAGPAHHLMPNLGYQNFYYELHDHPPG